VLASALLAAAAGCGGSGGGATESAAETTGPVVTTVAAGELGRPGVLRVCVDVPSPPFAEQRGGRLTGFEVQLVEAVARSTGLKPVWRDTQRVDLVEDLLAGKCDIVAAQLAVSYALQARISMVPYLQVDQAFLVRRGGPELADPVAHPLVLCGRAVAVVAGGGEQRTLEDFAGRCEDAAKPLPRVVSAATPREALAELRTRRADVVFDDLPHVAWYAAHAEGVKRLGGAIDHVNYGFGLRRARESLYFGLRAGLTASHEDGTFARLQKRWNLESSRVLALP
jgi:polar amino acid transport system substrate-binding protein